MTPVLTAVQGSNPAGPGPVAADPAMPSMSLHFVGENFDPTIVLWIGGPVPLQAISQPSIQNITATGFDAVVKVPVAGQYYAAVANIEPGNPPQILYSETLGFKVV